MANIRLKNIYPNSLPEQAYYFYDGSTIVRYGIIEVPSDNPTWLQRVWGDGFRIDPATGRTLELSEVLNPVAESTESAGEDVEDTNLGGQPAGEDGLRESEQSRDEGVPEPELDSSVGDRPKRKPPVRRAK